MSCRKGLVAATLKSVDRVVNNTRRPCGRAESDEEKKVVSGVAIVQDPELDLTGMMDDDFNVAN